MSTETIARRYAAALADVVTKTGETDNVKTELKSWEEMIYSNVDLQNAFRSPAIAHQKKEGVLEGLLKSTRPSKTTANFLKLLLRNSRLMALPDINDRFAAELEERSGNVVGSVISAHELSAAQREAIKSNLDKVSGKNVKLEFGIDKEIIGGVVARIGSTVYDNSVRTQLENLREKLIQR
jgi:F-type H+-transporting ATPase subunit delta